MLTHKLQNSLRWLKYKVRAYFVMGHTLVHQWALLLWNREAYDRAPRIRPFALWSFFGILAMLILVWGANSPQPRLEISYGDFLLRAEQGELSNLLISQDHITGYLGKGDAEARPFITYPLPDVDLARLLSSHGIAFSVESADSWLWLGYLIYLLPTALICLLLIVSFQRFRSPGSGMFSPIRKSLPIVLDSSNRIRFKDIAGTHEAKQELEETIAFLKNPREIERLGGRMPKGVLLIGAPGTGKTLLARAVAGEAGVPFFNISGSEFIEMFVGVGAARVRELFEQAREHAPCMIFVDEIDAIGRSRGGVQGFGAHDEREQTLNQLLSEMDGFDPSVGVIVMAATNRPEILDRALLRAGRFDRQIVVDRPGLADRLEILKLHARRLVLDEHVDLALVAQRTAGLVGADLANICNESAILAVRDHVDCIDMKHLEAAVDRVLAGPEKKSLVLTLGEKERVACHEAGHAIVAALLPNAQPVQKVSIIPRGSGVLGYTLQLPVEERFLSTEPELQNQMAVLMAGRKAEFLKFGNYSNGARNDLESATILARKMICEWGMSPTLGPVTLETWQRLKYLEAEGTAERNYSEQTAERIDQEIRTLLSNAEDVAGKILTLHHDVWKEIMQILIRHEVIEGQTIQHLVKGRVIESKA